MIPLSVATAILYVIGCLVLYKARPQLMAGYLLLLPSHAYNLISLILIESGGWILEQNRNGYVNGSTLIYAALLLVTLIGYGLAPLLFPKISISNYLKINQGLNNSNTQMRSIIIMMVTYIILFAYAHYKSSGVDGLHRFNTLAYVYPKWLIFFLVSTYGAIGWYAILRVQGFGYRLIISGLFAYGSTLYGGSFSTIIYVAALFFIAQSLEPSSKHSNSKLILVLLLAFIAASAFKIGQEYFGKKYTPEQLEVAVNFVELRLIEQAHLIWFAMERYFTDGLVDIGFQEFLLDFFNPTHTLTETYGLGRLMCHVNNGMAQHLIEEGIGMSAGFPSIVLASSGLVATLLACLIVGITHSLFFAFLVNCAKNFGFPIFFFAFYFFNQFTNIVVNGDFGFINFKTILYIIIFTALYHLGRPYLRGRVWPAIRL